MIGDALDFLRSHIDASLRVELGGSQDDAIKDRPVIIDRDEFHPVGFQRDAVTILLINVEEERILRNADAHAPGRDAPRLRAALRRGQADRLGGRRGR